MNHEREALSLVYNLRDPSDDDRIALAHVHATLDLADATIRAACIAAIPVTEYRHAEWDKEGGLTLQATKIQFQEHTARAMKALYHELTGKEW